MQESTAYIVVDGTQVLGEGNRSLCYGNARYIVGFM